MIELRRDNINELLNKNKSRTINPSLWLQKGLKELQEDEDTLANGEETPKTKHLKGIADFKAPDLYSKAFNRWFDLTSDENRFSQTVMTLENRLLIGLTGNAALETGCSLSRNYGMPYIPGSSVKGVVRAWAEKHLNDYADELTELFGTRDSDDVNRISGLVTFHDAWWIPHGSDKPFVLDVVTTHHQAYYNGQQDKPSDKDNPFPHHQLAVQGSFLFVLEGDPKPVELCQTMLSHVLQSQGIGAKTAAGYGYFKENVDLSSKLKKLSRERRMTVEEKRDYEISQLTASQLAIMFGRDLNKTKACDNLNWLIEKVIKYHRSTIDSWKDETKKSSKNRYKAYQFLKGREE